MKIRQLFRDLRLFANARKTSVKFLLAILVALSLIALVSSLRSNAASEITDKRYQYTYFTDGDFRTDGLDKSLMFYEYLPSGLSWDTLSGMVANFTADGVRCQYRIFGYKSGGGGTLVFDSGGGGMYGQAIDITGAGFDYYNILLSAYDKDGTQIQVGNIDSGYVIFSWGELVQLPTTPPELVDAAESAAEGINGTATIPLPPSAVTTSTVTVDFSDLDTPADVTSELWEFGSAFNVMCTIFNYLLYSAEIRIRIAIGVCMTLCIVSYILTKI